MDLQKRNCGISITLTPYGCYVLDVDFDFYGTKISFSPSSAMGDQFGAFLSALYTLYFEGSDGHSEWRMREYPGKTHRVHAITTTVDWDNEGTVMTFEMTKHLKGTNIYLKITTDYGETFTEFTVNEKDFCYAVAKACTDVLKQYGFYGYKYSTGKDILNLHQLLFIKAHALGNMDARDLIVVDEGLDCCKSNFEKELELLLFDM